MRSSESGDRIYPSKVPVLRHGFALWRLIRRWFSRREMTVRLLGLPISEGTADEPGLILLQIDGLSRVELESAIKHARLPFLRDLISQEGYRLHTMYSGLPATTPAVLAELFYGVPQAVPAFSFRDHRSGQVVEMTQADIASVIQNELEAKGDGLLKDGCAYCDIYSGGARESQFCPADMHWEALRSVSAWKKAAIMLLNLRSVLRLIRLLIVEFVLAFYECARGRCRPSQLIQELKFIPRRLIGAVVLRECTAIGVEADVMRGVPIIHANFVGYDELAHHRGPDSAFAHRGLRDIDVALRRIWNAAHGSRRRSYHIWLMSDHGQERTIPYSEEFGLTVVDAVKEIHASVGQNKQSSDGATSDDSSGPTVVAIGPVGYIYWPETLSVADIERLGPKLVSEARIPLVMAKADGRVLAWTKSGRFSMPEDGDRILASDHPHLPDVANDLTSLCSHPDAGEFLISGWRPERPPITFVTEYGSHGGPGPKETSGFLLLPPDAKLSPDQPLRPASLRRMVQSLCERHGAASRCETRAIRPDRLRVVTYNVHSCIGLDGRLSPSRIARVLASLEPDIVALQELDVRRFRTGGHDQAELIAKALRMEMQFHPAIDVVGERYGDAVLSRFPMTLKRAGLLPGLKRGREPRGAVWVAVQVGDQSIDVITTHLGLSAAERQEQVESLLGPDWLQNPKRRGPVVFCGDLNATPRSRVYRRIAEELRDAQLLAENGRPGSTWFSPFPLTRIDHLFVSSDIQVVQASVGRSRLARVASDHLPVVVDLVLSASSRTPHTCPAAAVLDSKLNE